MLDVQVFVFVLVWIIFRLPSFGRDVLAFLRDLRSFRAGL
jgi:hypothetical protein